MVATHGHTAFGRADDLALRELLTSVVAERLGREREIETVDRSLHPHIGSYDCYTLSVGLRGGERLRLFLKDYRFSRQSKDTPDARKSRELRVYRELLSSADLGTPAYYASVEEEGRCWLLIELMEGAPVDRVDLEFGALAAGWLAQLHQHFSGRQQQLARSGFLVRFDAEFFQRRLRAARRDVARLSPADASRFDRLAPICEDAIPALTAGPPTLVHGGFIPWHLMVDRGCDPVRVCVIDWELAGLGSPLYDLAYFADDGTDDVVEAICEAYRGAAAGRGLAPPDGATLRRSVHCLRLYRVVDWLSRGVERGFSPEKVSKLVTRAEDLACHVPV